MNVILGSGDHVIVHAPYYQSLGEVARSLGAEVTEWQGDSTRGWELDLEVLKAALTPRTKVVVVNFPHNSTGFLPSLEFVRALSELSERHGFIIFSDEVYRGLELDSSERLPALAGIIYRAVSLGVMSKTFGLAGLRIGWIATCYCREHSIMMRPDNARHAGAVTFDEVVCRPLSVVCPQSPP